MDSSLTFVIIDDNSDNGVSLISGWQKSFPENKDRFFWIQLDDRLMIDEDSTPEVYDRSVSSQLKKGFNCLTTTNVKKALETLDNIKGDLIISYDLELGTKVWDEITNNLSKLIKQPSRVVTIVIHSTGQEKEGILKKLDPTNSYVEGVIALTPLKNNTDRKKAVNEIVSAGYRLWMSKQKPLEHLWNLSKNWFSKSSKAPGEPLMVIHSFEKIKEIKNVANLYADDLHTAFGFSLPSIWFDDLKSIEIIHENLKHLCGTHYLGCGGGKNLSVGAVYFIALMAHFKVRDNIEPLVKNVPTWYNLSNSKDAFLSENQTPDAAKRTALSHYYLFERLFEPERIKNDQFSEVINCCFPGSVNGKKFFLEFNWDLENNLSTEISSKFSVKSNRAKESEFFYRLWPKEPSNVKNAFFQFAHFMYIDGKSFINPGVVFLNKKYLFVASGNTRQFIALVACTEETRRIAWARLLLGYFDKILTCWGIDDWSFFDGEEHRISSKSELPKSVDALFLHQSDVNDLKEFLGQIDVSYKFCFDAPGTPNAVAHNRPIMRMTSPNFELGVQDSQEISEYVKGIRRELPSCCLPKKGMELLPALAILCQGYLAVHAEYDGQDKNWQDEELHPALEQMGLYSLKKEHVNLSASNNLGNKIGTVRNRDWWLGIFDVFHGKNDEKKETVEKNSDAFENELLKEWEGFNKLEVPEVVKEFILYLHDQKNVETPKLVADFYCAIVDRLQGRRCAI